MVLAAPLDNIQMCLVSCDPEIIDIVSRFSLCSYTIDVIPKCTDLNGIDGYPEAISRCTIGGSSSLGLLAWCKLHASLGSTDPTSSFSE